MEERLYDLIFITRPATPEDEIKKVLSGIEHNHRGTGDPFDDISWTG